MCAWIYLNSLGFHSHHLCSYSSLYWSLYILLSRVVVHSPLSPVWNWTDKFCKIFERQFYSHTGIPNLGPWCCGCREVLAGVGCDGAGREGGSLRPHLLRCCLLVSFGWEDRNSNWDKKIWFFPSMLFFQNVLRGWWWKLKMVHVVCDSAISVDSMSCQMREMLPCFSQF